jgi:sortase B
LSNKNKTRVILFCTFLAVFVFAAVYIVIDQVNVRNRHQTSAQLATEARIETVEEEYDLEDRLVEIDGEEEEVLPQPSVEIPIDFAMLQEINPDVHAWIRIPGTAIDYPILQSTDYQEFYLNHDINRQPDVAGALFTQDFNSLNFRDVHTIIYGHDMADGSKFGILHRYLSGIFMEEHEIIYIYTPWNIFRYQIVYAVTYDDRHILMSFDFEDDKDYELFIYSLRNNPNINNHWNPNATWRVGDPLITLSTCTDNRYQRLLIGAVLIEEF